MPVNDKSVLVFGGTGSIGGAVINSLLERQIGLLTATYRSGRPQTPETVRWVKFQVGSTQIEEFTKWVEENMARLDAVVFSIGAPSSKRFVVHTPEEEWRSLFYGSV